MPGEPGPLTPGFVLNPHVDGITGGGWILKAHVLDFTLKHVFVPGDKRHLHLEAVLHEHCIGHGHKVLILLGADGLVDLL